jgi:hypothetical protein
VKGTFYKEMEYVFHIFPNYHMKILLGDFNAKVCREDIFKPTIGNKSLQVYEISNDNEVKIINFDTSKNLTDKILRSHIATTISTFQGLQMGKPTIRLIIFW